VAIEVTHSLFQTVRPYADAFSIYGDKLGFEWQQIEDEDPMIFSMPQAAFSRCRTIYDQMVAPPTDRTRCRSRSYLSPSPRRFWTANISRSSRAAAIRVRICIWCRNS
jgi:hypothetical protein